MKRWEVMIICIILALFFSSIIITDIRSREYIDYIQQQEQENLPPTQNSKPWHEVKGTIKPEVANLTQDESYFEADIYYYCPCERCTGKTADNPSRGITSSGQKAIPYYTIAADPSIPFGTIYEININGNIGYYEVQDRGGNITSNKLDIFVDNHNQALLNGNPSGIARIIRWGVGNGNENENSDQIL